MRLEAQLIRSRPWSKLSWPDRIRKLRVLSPLLTPLYCLAVKRGLLDGRAGWHYAFQRLAAEVILSLHLLGVDVAPDEE